MPHLVSHGLFTRNLLPVNCLIWNMQFTEESDAMQKLLIPTPQYNGLLSFDWWIWLLSPPPLVDEFPCSSDGKVFDEVHYAHTID